VVSPDGLGLGGDWVDDHVTPPPISPLTVAVDTSGPDTTSAAPDEERCFPGLEEWVVGWLAPTVRRQHNENAFRWCPQWWAHAEAISRLNGLWEAWENARTEGSVAMLGWWQVFDHHATILTSTGGPFAQCTQSSGHRSDGAPLKTVPAPPGTWAED
jgi:hypothetical protein